MRCPLCRSDNPSDASFCGDCGGRLTGARPAVDGAPAAFGAGRYTVQRLLGEGGRKRVYLARDERLDRAVAVAVLKTEGLDQGAVGRLAREAQAMGRLGDHPNIVTVYDVIEGPSGPSIVSQHMPGGSVADLLADAEGHRLALEDAVRIGVQVARGLAHAHGRGIVHRDVKPGNVWLAADGTAKLGDFGLAVASDLSPLTVEGMIVGTVAYMPPEQALGNPPDARSDLYSLGVMLYEMLCGRPPFLGDDAVAIISQHLNTAPVAPSWHSPDVPRPLEALVLGLLEKDPDRRPATAALVAEELGAIAAAAFTTSDRASPEEANPLDRLAGGVFVGREREMEALRSAFGAAASGRGRLVLLAGEPGIGKTRVADELATYASLRRARTLWGRCYEGEGAPSYWPWIQVVRAWAAGRDPAEIAADMGQGAAVIAQVVSEVRERLPDLPEPPSLDPEQARFRLFDAVASFLKNAARERPLFLVLDDLHWADRPSLLLLEFLARELRDARLLVVGTYRDVEVGRHHPLAQTLATLARERLSERVALRGLSEGDVDRFIAMTAGFAAPEGLAPAVHRETEGNPFFVTEVVRLLVAEGRLQRAAASWAPAIPEGVREVVGRRLDRLSDECNGVLATASVIGREFGLDVLRRVAEVPGDRLLQALDEAVAARVVAESSGAIGRYEFSHALVRETLYEELPMTRRIALHRRIGEALEALEGPDPGPRLAELAHHFFQAARAGDAQRAVDYAIRAGARALARMAYEEAALHHERALQLLDLDGGGDERRRCDLLLALGDARAKAGEPGTAREAFQNAAAVARGLLDPDLFARAALGFGGDWSDFGRVDEPLVALLEEAIQGVGADAPARAMLLGRLAMALYESAPVERRDALTREAVDIARRSGDPRALATVLHARHIALWGPENVSERLVAATEILELAARTGDKELALLGYVLRIVDLLEMGDVGAADGDIEAHARLATELRQPYHLWYAGRHRATRAILDGRFEDAERAAGEALAMGRRGGQRLAAQLYAIQVFALRREQGRLEELEAGTRRLIERYPGVPAWRCGLAFIEAELGRDAEARADFERLASGDFAAIPRDLAWVYSMTQLAEVCAFLRDRGRAPVLYDALLPYAGRNVVIARAAACLGSASHFLGLLAATTGRLDEAARHFDDALAMNRRLGARPRLAGTQTATAAMLLGRDGPGDRGRALALLGEALETARSLGMRRLIERAVDLRLRALGVRDADALTSIEAVSLAVQEERPDIRRHAAPDGAVTLLFSDMEGYSDMVERLGDRGAQGVLRAHNAVVRREVTAHGGVEVKSAGDGFMIAFADPQSALACAVAIQRAISAAGLAEPVRLRIGLHTGEAIRELDDFYGRNVIVAARIADAASGGEILVSDALRDTAGSAFRFEETREIALEGLRGTYRVHALAWTPAPTGESASS